MVCADPAPTLQNIRITEIYEQLGREQTPPNKPKSLLMVLELIVVAQAE